MLTFITGNKNKFAEVEAMLGVPLVQMAIDLPEIQSLDPHEVLRAKAEAAMPHVASAFIIEDSSFSFSCLGGKLPGTFIKWFGDTLGNVGMAELAERMGDTRAETSAYFAHVSETREVTFFEGRVQGTIVPPRGGKDFGFGAIFLPDGSPRTYGEMEREEKYRVSMRALAAHKLKDFLGA